MSSLNLTFSNPRCPRCSSRATEVDDDLITFVCGTEMIHDALDGWVHDWSEDALEVCSEVARLSEQVGQLEGIHELAGQLREALAFAAVCIRGGEPWTDKCEQVIGNALTMAKLRL